jgi:large subunit ribosomal protein L6
MSRIGKKPVAVPSNVKVAVDPSKRIVNADGPKGKLDYTYHREVDVAWDESEKSLSVTIPEHRQDERKARAQWGTARSRIQNMIAGVTQGFERKLEIVGVGWNAQAQGKTLRLNIGYCHPVDMTPPDGVEFKVEGQIVTISGCDKQQVGQFAAECRSKRKPEPYNGKGIKYIDEILIRKEGKAFGK